ncbi:alkaline phosphatase family protein [Plantibacter sp. RU18]|uniref:alkaline phosphatase family protein n=1 Tax=Plantibacter sp. RU18 TaxID=3158143 RepID=UPI003D36F6B2
MTHDEEAPPDPELESATPKRPASRRDFFRAAGFGVAGLAAGGAVTGGIAAVNAANTQEEYGFTPLPKRSEPGFDHVVVVMFENRSFDHMLGWLYRAGGEPAGQTFDGLAQGDYSNPGDSGETVPAHIYTGPTDQIMAQPDPDPGEFYPHVNTQLFGTIDPESNGDLRNPLQPPWNLPADSTAPKNDGFVKDYIVNSTLARGRKPTPEEYAVVMGGFSPTMLPVLSTLAKNFGVYDHWYAAVPSQTFCNRSFFHASTSHGYVTNVEGGGIGKWLSAPAVPTVFTRLEDAGKTWRVYYDAQQVVSLTGLLSAPSIEKYWKTNFRSMEQFHDDAKNGNLPDYAFIEPRMVFDHNDMHPPVVRPVDRAADPDTPNLEETPERDSAFSDMRAGEQLLGEVYTAVKNSASGSGSNAMNTVLLVTFDEHGGIYDHVAPPKATPPSGSASSGKAEAGEMGFTFDRLGLRVPSIVISAYTKAGSVINEEMHHGSLMKTLAQLHGLDPLTERDDTATSIFNAVNLTTPRQPALWPTVTPAYVPPNPEANPRADTDKDRTRPLTPPALGLIGILLAKYEPDAPLPDNYADAYAALMKHGDGLFGTTD